MAAPSVCADPRAPLNACFATTYCHVKHVLEERVVVVAHHEPPCIISLCQDSIMMATPQASDSVRYSQSEPRVLDNDVLPVAYMPSLQALGK